ncbi:AzlC family ABC transporter permease [Ideonella sp. B7]|uniref:AzlC family ABC transporter permease n=1 Tax=Ideonella benzenivorans TaxID=2831643 RepID=UPI001CED76F8|nr:AzlC family ABC transporter permease [Ideonella benzenivorans]MCA6217276.1 AzlC family ABC transporter permease [Ideonella benzenivorans]
MLEDSPGSLPLWRQPEFARGFRDLGSASLGIGAWGLVTGVAMVKSGLGVPLSLAMTFLVFAGSAQLAALPLIVQGAPMWLVWATAACVNLRFVIFSAGWRPYFGHRPFWQKVAHAYLAGDLNYVMFLKRFPDPVPQDGQWAYYWGGATVNWLGWQGFSVLGIVLAHHIPTEWGLGFAGTLALLGLTGSLLVDRATWVAAAVAACAAVAAYALPLKLNIVVAIAAALAVGLVMDRLAPAGRLLAQRKEL